MRPIPAGAQGWFAMTVSAEHLANRYKDASLPAVLATPVMTMAMENAALEALKPYFETGESAVGTRVDVSHLAAAPAGRRMVASAEVTASHGRHIEFRVNAMDGSEEIGRGNEPLMRAGVKIPIVFVISADPVAAKIVESFSHPGGNLTGISLLSLDLMPKRNEFLK